MGSKHTRMSKPENLPQVVADAASGGAKVAGVGVAAAASWGLQDWSHFAAILSALVAIIGGVIYSIKMLVEIYWLNRIRSKEAERLEKESQHE